MIYTGVGSRETPQDVLIKMRVIGKRLARDGWILRSGGADGADTAFETGCDLENGRKEIFLPWKGFNGSNSELYEIPTLAYDIASEIHPTWSNCKESVRRLHARNVCQVLGYDLDNPSNLVICWTKNGEDVGGTRTSIILARQHNIKVYNMGKSSVFDL